MRARSAVKVFLSGLLLVSSWSTSVAQTVPPEIPAGRIAADFFYFLHAVGPGGNGFYGRSSSPDEAILLYSQAATANSPDGSVLTPNGPCMYFPGTDGFNVPDIASAREVIGDSVVGQRRAKYQGFNGFCCFEGPIALAVLSSWQCPYKAISGTSGLVTTGTFIMPVQVVCPCGYNVTGYTSDGRARLCTKETTGIPVDGCHEKMVGRCEAGALFEGNPINPATGAACKVEDEVDDIRAAIGLVPFERHYSSLATGAPPGGFGRAWRHTYDKQIRWQGSNTAYAVREDGRALLFVLVSGQWTPDVDISDQLNQVLDAGGTPTGWQYTEAKTENREIYDISGRLIKIVTRPGVTQAFTYSDGTVAGPSGGVFVGTSIALPAGLLIRVTDSFGRSVSLGYDQKLRVVQLTNPSGGTLSYDFDTHNNLVAVHRADGTVRRYLYNESALTGGANLPRALTGIIDENSVRYATFTYNAAGRAIASEHAGGAGKVLLTYGAVTNQNTTTTVTDSLGTARTYSFQTAIGVPRTTGINPPCLNCRGAAITTVGPNGLETSRVDWNGNRTNYTYDLARNLETSRTEGLTSAGAITPQTRTVNTQWDINFRLPGVIAEPLRITTNEYDPDGTRCGARGALCSRTIQATTDANGSQAFSATLTGTPRTWAYTYNTNGSVLTADGPRTDVSDVTTYTYYADDDPDIGKRGNVAKITNAADHVTNITAYNAHGQPLTIVDPNGLTTQLAYDPRQRLTSRTVGTEVTAYEYDGVGQLTKVTLPDGSFLAYSYDPAHRLVGMRDNLGNRIAYTLDAMGNRTQEQVFDPANSLAQTRSRVFSNLNRLFQEIGAAGQVTEYGYDNQGNVTSVKDPVNKVTANAYDALNRLRQVTDPALGVTRYGYNGLDALVQVTDSRNLTTGYTVNGLGDLTLQQSPDTGNTASTYDPAGNLLTQTDAKNQTTTYAYDALNRVTLITFHDGSRQAYAYDLGANGLGRLSSITEISPASQTTSVIAYAYDAHGRVVAETRSLGAQAYVTAYQYDAAGRLQNLTYPSGRAVSYAFDVLGRVSAVSTGTPSDPPEVVVRAVSYHPFGGVTSFTFGNGQVYSRSVDQDGRIASYTLGAETYALAFDAASRITGISQLGNPANVNSYGYDALDRLTAAVLPNSTFGYTYDAVGNRLTKSVGGTTDLYAYSATSNRIVSVTPAVGTFRAFTFDANGSTLADGQNTYAYDARGRMVQSVSGFGATTYRVNALGQRVRKTNSATDTIFHYDTRGRLIAESDPGGNSRREYIYLGDIPVGVIQ